jgi:hypothetical protein
MDWIPLLEMETKKNVRKWNIEDIFGFKVSGFAEIAAMGACLKFVNNDVPDIDLAKKYRSSNEEIKGTISIWKVALTIIVLLFLWGIYAQITSMKTYRIFEKQKVARVDGIEEFRNLSASQIRDRVAQMKENALDLSALIVQPKYTTKLSALPDLMPDEMFFKNLQITYPIASKAGRAQNSIVVNGMIHSLEGSKVELTEGSKFNSRVGSSPAMADLCKNNISWDYPPNTRSAALGTAFSMKCSRE